MRGSDLTMRGFSVLKAKMPVFLYFFCKERNLDFLCDRIFFISELRKFNKYCYSIVLCAVSTIFAETSK